MAPIEQGSLVAGQPTHRVTRLERPLARRSGGDQGQGGGPPRQAAHGVPRRGARRASFRPGRPRDGVHHAALGAHDVSDLDVGEGHRHLVAGDLRFGSVRMWIRRRANHAGDDIERGAVRRTACTVPSYTYGGVTGGAGGDWDSSVTSKTGEAASTAQAGPAGFRFIGAPLVSRGTWRVASGADGRVRLGRGSGRARRLTSRPGQSGGRSILFKWPDAPPVTPGPEPQPPVYSL
jgi:hypothetical protein